MCVEITAASKLRTPLMMNGCLCFSAQTSGKCVLGHPDAQVFWIIHSRLSLSRLDEDSRIYVLMNQSMSPSVSRRGRDTFLRSSVRAQAARQAGRHTHSPFFWEFILIIPKYTDSKPGMKSWGLFWKSPVDPDEPLPTGPHQNQVHAKLSADSEPPPGSWIIYADSGMFGLILVLSLCRTLALTFSSHVLRGGGAVGLSDQNGSYLGLGHHQMSVGGLCTCGWAWSWSMQTHCRPCGMRWNKWPQWSWLTKQVKYLTHLLNQSI